MSSRPIGPLVEALREQGADIQPPAIGSFPLTMHSVGLSGGNIHLSSGNESSQYLSGMLMAAPLARKPVEVETLLSVSRPYADMTIRMMREFGVSVKQEGYERFQINAPASYQARPYVIEADASTASYCFGAAAITGGNNSRPEDQ
jgi:3-phosphoshikimate 1-carboxyvinyltransferase